MHSVPVLLYSFGVVKWAVDELLQIDLNTRDQGGICLLSWSVCMNCSESLHCLVRDHEMAGVEAFLFRALQRTPDGLNFSLDIS